MEQYHISKEFEEQMMEIYKKNGFHENSKDINSPEIIEELIKLFRREFDKKGLDFLRRYEDLFRFLFKIILSYVEVVFMIDKLEEEFLMIAEMKDEEWELPLENTESMLNWANEKYLQVFQFAELDDEKLSHINSNVDTLIGEIFKGCLNDGLCRLEAFERKFKIAFLKKMKTDILETMIQRFYPINSAKSPKEFDDLFYKSDDIKTANELLQYIQAVNNDGDYILTPRKRGKLLAYVNALVDYKLIFQPQLSPNPEINNKALDFLCLKIGTKATNMKISSQTYDDCYKECKDFLELREYKKDSIL